jgi:phosphohistidine phosphatase
MDLLIVRHAIAMEREEWRDRPDTERPLTAAGRERMERNVRGLRRIHPELDRIATSPLVRARQTAGILADGYRGPPVLEVAPLAPGGRPEEVAEWVGGRTGERIALVGHEPDLGRLVSWFLYGDSLPPLEMKKGGACLLRFTLAIGARRASLRWFLPPRVLRRLAR